MSCAGTGTEALWRALLSGKTPIDRHVPEFDASHLGGPKELRRLDPFTLYALAAADEAWRQSGLDETYANAASIVATGIGGLQTLTEQFAVLTERGANRVSPFMIPMMMPNAAAAAVSMRFGTRGPCETITTACAAGTHAIGYAARLVAAGRVEVAVTGGAEAVMTPLSMAGFTNMTALSGSGISRPFDVDRDGFVMGEGAGILIIESLDHAVARGATILAEIRGAASTADAYHLTAPDPDGAGAVECIRLALRDAQLEPNDIDHVNAHGTSTPLNDRAESLAISAVFGERRPPVTSTKGYLGHSLAAAGALEAVVSVLTLLNQSIPATLGTVSIDPAIDVDVVLGQPRPHVIRNIISNSFGFGGHNGCLIISQSRR
ncbi:MAG: beta-ketoacyl-ACP synthase II [Actinobacteria bacterium]|nr:beta-ketoacyl-ACP synthase II [Actinomycetota bacterium]